MAKETVSPIERHLEKGVLALTVLLFVGVVVKYLVSSPNIMLVGRDEVGPREIYDKVADEARALRERIRTHREDVKLPKPPEMGGPTVAAVLLPSPVPFGPRVPRLKTEEIGNIGLVTVVAPGKPEVIIGRSGAVLSPTMPITAMPDKPDDYYQHWNEIPQHDEQYLVAVNWATVATTFDVDAQRRRAIENGYPPGRAVPYLVGADLQRRKRHWDGTHGEWKDVKTYAPLGLPDLPYLAVEEHDGKMMIPDDQRAKIVRFARDVRNEDRRLELMRPMPPPAAYGDYWRMEAFDLGGLDLLRLDDEVLWGEEYGNCPYWDRYPKPPRPDDWQPPDLTKREVAFREVNKALDEVEGWIEQGCYDVAVRRLEDLARTADQYFTDQQRERREAMLEKASTLLAKKERAAEERKRKGEPDPLRETSPLQVVWVHDALPDSVVSGKTYQYRTRALLYNNFAGAAQELKNPKDADIVLLESEWSPPSDDIAIPYDTEFFLVGKKERDGTVKVDVFKWHEGAWMKSSFQATVGDPIGGKEFVKHGKGPKIRVDFSTGATVVDLDFNHPYRARKERRGVVTIAEPKPTVAMVYLDSAGELHERLLDVDKRSQSYKAMKAEVGKPAEPGPGGP